MRSKRRFYMNRGRIVWMAVLTVCAACALILFVGFTINSVNRQVTQSCFDELADASRQLADELYKTVETDRTILAAMAALIAWPETADDAALCEIMGSYKTRASYMSYVELLRPDGTMLDTDGTARDVSDAFDFSAETRKGAYISNIERSTLDPNEKVLRNAVPVVKDGETIYMIYGVVRLSELAERYTTGLYDGHAYVYIADGDTGDFLLDTWHKTLGNIIEMGARTMLPGHSLEDAISNMQNGVGGELGFVSKTQGDVLYIHYEPVGVNNWNVLISVERQYAMAKSRTTSASLYRMAAVIGIVMLLYAACMIYALLRAYRQVRRLGMIDQNTGLQNRNAYDHYISEHQNKRFDAITCVYVDVNGLHDVNNQYGHAEGDRMLRTVANALEREFRHGVVYRVGGDEFIVFCEDDQAVGEEKMRNASKRIESHGYHIAFGIVSRKNVTGMDDVIREADARMLENKRAYYVAHDRRKRY